jgi:hypothetical protein
MSAVDASYEIGRVNAQNEEQYRRIFATQYEMMGSRISTTTDPVTLLYVAGNFGSIWSVCGQYEVQYTE